MSHQQIFGQIPDPIRKLLFLKCPRCGHRTWNCKGSETLGYQAHYMEHMLVDMKEREMIHMEKVEMTITELLTAYKNGTLTAPLMLDNDQVSVWPDNEDATEATFDMDPYDLLTGLLTFLKIPWEHV